MDAGGILASLNASYVGFWLSADLGHRSGVTDAGAGFSELIIDFGFPLDELDDSIANLLDWNARSEFMF